MILVHTLRSLGSYDNWMISKVKVSTILKLWGTLMQSGVLRKFSHISKNPDPKKLIFLVQNYKIST